MVKSCSAIDCTNRSQKGADISFYRFPADPERRAQWIAAVRRVNWTPNKNSWLCSKHFISGTKSDDPLSPNYIPSVFKFVVSPVKRKQQQNLESYERRKKRRLLLGSSSISSSVSSSTSAIQDSAVGVDEQSVAICIPPDYPATSSHVSTAEQLDVDADGAVSLQCHNKLLQSQVEQLRAENKLLRAGNTPFEDSLICDDESVKFYTGLPSYAVLMVVFDFVACHVTDHHRWKMSKFDQFMLVLMKLRLNLFDADLARRFGVSQSTVSKLVMKWVHIMYVRLKPLVIWPEREDLLRTMPRECAKYFKRCVVIIDCFEVFCERPSGLMARAQTFSNYKHHNTVKFLIGITPQGVISYVSEGWGGRTSDKYLTENCGFLKNLLPGDQVMADRGFTISESVGVYGAELVIPPFTRGKKQLSQVEVDRARQLSRVRIHVERVIGLLRNKYTILQATLPITLLMHDGGDTKACALDKIVLVCSALCNCCESVVPLG